jgi:uncharacterized membrane protein
MKLWLIVSIAVTAAVVGASLFIFVNRAEWLPEEVPTHWNAKNVVDKYTPRDDMLVPLMLLPGVMLLIMVMALVLPWLSPEKFKVEPFRATWDYIMALVVILFGYIQVVILAAYTEQMKAADLPRWLVGGLLLMMALLGNQLGKVQRNFWMGVRTPWTLASDTVWIRTHRLAAWLFVGGALFGFAILLIGINPLWAVGAFGVAAIFPVFYSLWLYKRLEKAGQLGNGAGAHVPAP